MIVQKLREIQHKHGWLPERELRELSALTATPLHRIHEVASVFPHYRLKEGPTVEVHVCRDMACHLHGAPALEQALDQLGHPLSAISRILVTHVHRDHYTLAVQLRREYGIPVSLGAGERPA